MIHSRLQRIALLLGTLLCFSTQASESEQPSEVESSVSSRVLALEQVDNFSQAGIEAGKVDINETLSSLLPYFSYPPVSNAGLSGQFRPLMMRGLSPDHTIVLVNGKRRHSAALLHVNDTVGRGALAVDLNMIPAVAVESVEISREGASATFGSDAIAGVVNFRLKESLGGSFRVSLGTHITEVTDVADLLEVDSSGNQLLFNTSGDRNPDDGDGNVLTIAGDWGFRLGRSGFVHFSAELRDSEDTDRTGFDARQQYATLEDGTLDIREQTFNRFSHQHGSAEIEDINFFINAGYPMMRNIDLYFFGSHGKRKATSAMGYRRALDARNLVAVYPDGFLPVLESNVDDISVTLGFRGETFGWQWDLSYTDANNEIDLKLEDSLNVSLGLGSPLVFAVGNNENHQQLFNVDLSRSYEGGLLPTPIDVVVGLEFRKESYEIERGDPASFINGGFENDFDQAGAIGSQGFPGIRPQDEFDEGRDSSALYINLSSAVGENLGLMLSARYDDYSDVGGQASVKIAARYQIGDALSLHASIGNGFRAPDLAQQFYRVTQSVAGVGVMLDNGIYSVESDVAVALGSRTLKVEESIDINLGVDYVLPSSSALHGLEFSLNFYRINIDDRIVLSDELAGPEIIALLQDAGIATVDNVRYFHNGVDTRTQGLDLSSRYAINLARHGQLKLQVALNYNTNRVDKVLEASVLSSSGLSRFDRRAQKQLEKGVSESRLILSAEWQKERMRATLRFSGFGSTTLAAESADLDQKLDALWLLDLFFRYQATEKLSLVIGSNNVLDTYPDVAPLGEEFSEFNRIYPFSNYSPYGYNGRLVYASVTTTF